eukprot:2982366-Prymnesium_polylepis.1
MERAGRDVSKRSRHAYRAIAPGTEQSSRETWAIPHTRIANDQTNLAKQYRQGSRRASVEAA